MIKKVSDVQNDYNNGLITMRERVMNRSNRVLDNNDEFNIRSDVRFDKKNKNKDIL